MRPGNHVLRIARPLRILLLSCLALLAACGDGGGGKASGDAAPVRVIPAERADVPRILHVVGNVRASASVEITSRVTGEIVGVHFTEGQDVEEGQALISLDDRPFTAILREKEAQLARTRAQLAKADEDRNRYASLVRGGYVSREAYDKTVTDAATLRATLRSDEAAVESAALQVRYCTLSAPIGGRVGALAADRGNIVKENAATPLLTIRTISPCYVSFSVPEQHLSAILGRMSAGDVRVTAAPLGGSPEDGRLTLVENEVDIRTGTIRLRATFENTERRLWPGQFVNVSLPLGVEKGALLLPTAAVQAGRDGAYAYVITDAGTADLRPLRPLFEHEGRTVVNAGLREGERVVTEGMVRLAPGVPVRILP